MAKVVLDSSALLAYLQDEPGAARVAQCFGEAVMSTVNLAEVVSKLIANGASFESIKVGFDDLGIDVADFTRSLAEEAGRLTPATSPYGLSLGDRACFALAKHNGMPVMAADKAWRDVDVGVRVDLIR